MVGLIQLLASLHDEHGNTTIDGLDATQTWDGVDYPAEQFRADANVLDGVELMGDGTSPTCCGRARRRPCSASTSRP